MNAAGWGESLVNPELGFPNWNWQLLMNDHSEKQIRK
jgi:hypothetical protein